MRLTARKAQRTFGSGFLNAGYLAACLRDKLPVPERSALLDQADMGAGVRADAATLSQVGDAVLKINQAIPGYFDKRTLRDISGIQPGDNA